MSNQRCRSGPGSHLPKGDDLGGSPDFMLKHGSVFILLFSAPQRVAKRPAHGQRALKKTTERGQAAQNGVRELETTFRRILAGFVVLGGERKDVRPLGPLGYIGRSVPHHHSSVSHKWPTG